MASVNTLFGLHIWRRSRMRRTFLAAGAAALLMGACSKGTTRPIADGYTLHGVVTARDGAPLRDVSGLLGWEGSGEFHPFAMTGDDGAFLFQPAPATGPSTELSGSRSRGSRLGRCSRRLSRVRAVSRGHR